MIFRLLEEVSELEHSMRQLELKNENSEGSLRDMQVRIRYSVVAIHGTVLNHDVEAFTK